MTYREKKRWLEEQGLVSRSGHGLRGFHIRWTPWGDYSDEYYFESSADTIEEVYTKVFEEAKETLFQDCDEK